MMKWTADFVINPDAYDDFTVEILCDEKDVAFITRGEGGLELKWYAHDEDLIIPFDWLLGLMTEINNRLESKKIGWKFEQIK